MAPPSRKKQQSLHWLWPNRWIRAFSSSPSLVRPSRQLDAMLDDAREHFEEQFKKIIQRAKDLGVEMQTDIAVGHPVEQIVHRAETDHVDLIVLGRRGKSRWEKMLVGSTAEKVLRYAHCPVMVVR
jgi:nucleotide-binding universal stress UspA family protein